MNTAGLEICPLPAELEFETLSPLQRGIKRVLVNPLGNYVPARLMRWMLRVGRCRLAAANWRDPGGWESMVISYNGHCSQLADKILVRAGTIPMALRNRKRLAAHLMAQMIEEAAKKQPGHSVHVLCLGAGPGQIVGEAMTQTDAPAHATLVDLSTDAFDYGRKLAEERGLTDRMHFVQADVRDLRNYLRDPPNIVKMLGICEYLEMDQIVTIARAAGEFMPEGGAIVFNSLSRAHGTDRFFRRVFGLHMNHRDPEALCALMAQAGFGNFAVHREPLGVYHVIVGRKVAPAGESVAAPPAT